MRGGGRFPNRPSRATDVGARRLVLIWSRWAKSIGADHTGYGNESFSNPLWVGIYGHLFSAGKSVFLFAPLLVFALSAALLLPPPLIGSHTAWMWTHQFKPQKQDIDQKTSSRITIDDMRFHPRYSQITATWELLVYAVTGRRSRSDDPEILGSTWVQGIAQPPPPLDLIWWPRRK